MKVKQIHNKGALHKILEESGNDLVVIDFFAEWCGPCKRLAPEMDKMAAKHKNVHFYKVDVDNDGEEKISQHYKIRAMPTILFFKKEEEIKGTRIEGAKVDEITKTVEKHSA